MNETFWAAEFAALLQVLLIDVALAGDNAIVVGMAAAGVDPAIRSRVIFWGIAGAVVLRIGLALIAVQLLAVVGLTLAGGLLLLYVCYKMFREIKEGNQDPDALTVDQSLPRKTFGQALFQIMLADVSMSLDNVLAVAGAAREHPMVLVFGLALSIALMGVAATFIARLLQNHRWIAYVGLAIILYVAGDMIYRGFREVYPYATAYLAPVL